MLDGIISGWSLKTFPDLTIEQQLLKLESELEEFEISEEGEKSLEELADVYIVCTILERRFNSRIGKALKETIATLLQDNMNVLIEAVEAKMDINYKRKWHKTEDGEYRHDEDSSK